MTQGSGLDTPATTIYTYNALDNLTGVQQEGGTSDSSQWRARTSWSPPPENWR
jgi:hypothetical protein